MLTFNSLTLTAWPLNPAARKDEVNYKVRIPRMLKDASVQHNRVGLVTSAKEVYVWTIGAQLRSIDSSAALDQLSGMFLDQAAVYFHPDDERRFFVIYMAFAASGKADYVRLLVQEFDDAGVCSIQHIDIFNCTPYPSLLKPLIREQPIAILRVNPQCTMDLQPCTKQTEPCQHSSGASKGLLETTTLVTYDIYTKEFAFQTHHCPPRYVKSKSHVIGT